MSIDHENPAQWQAACAQFRSEGDRLAAAAREQASKLAPWGCGVPSAEELESTFEQACLDLQQGQYEKAARSFAAISAIQTEQAPVFFGLGLSLQMLGHVQAARDAYIAAYLLDPLDPACLLRMGECLMGLREPEEARQAWLTGLKLCARRGVDPALKGFLTQALDRLHA